MDWKPVIEKLSPEEVKLMVLGVMEFYTDGIIPAIDEDKYPRLDMFFIDKIPYMTKLEDDRLKKLQDNKGASPTLPNPLGGKGSVEECVDVNVGVEVGVGVPISVDVSVPEDTIQIPNDENRDDEHSVNVETSTNVYPSPNSPEFNELDENDRILAMDYYFNL